MKQKLVEYLFNQSSDIDQRVRYYLDKIGDITRSTYKKTNLIIPEFSNKTDQSRWENEQIRRTRYGYDGICGMMYMYTHFWKMKSKNGGLISPEFRRCNAEFFNLIESCLYGESDLYPSNLGKGVILVGRRRWGKSYSLANAMYCTAIHNPYSEIGFTSKTERRPKDGVQQPTQLSSRYIIGRQLGIKIGFGQKDSRQKRQPQKGWCKLCDIW
jgi:hypothetical protein